MTTLLELNQAQLMCRTVGHAWDTFTPLRKAPAFGELLAFRCVRCTTERHDTVSWVDGSLVQREYRYPDNYKLAERYFRNDYRLALMKTLKTTKRRGRAS